MAILLCPNGHYYDDKRNCDCPYCEKINQSATASVSFNEQLTSYISPAEMDDDVQLTEGYGESVNEFEKTIGIFLDENENVLTAGWLVCITGLERGKSYVIRSGRNFAGRSPEMDIVLSDDEFIVREKHFSIVFDPKSIAFYLVSGEGQTYINGQVVTAEHPLNAGDILQVGHSEYRFVPYCREGCVWE